MTKEEREQLTKRIDDAVTLLAEHVDSIQIFACLHDAPSDETVTYEKGRGNFYTRYAQIAEWLIIQHEFQRCHARRKDSEPKD